MKKLIFFCLSFFVALEGVSQSCGDDGFWKIGSQFGTQRLSSNCGNFSLYPNPSSSSISIKSGYKGPMDLEIIPLYKSSKILEFKITADEKVDIQDLPKGDYLVRVRIGEDVVLESRLIKNE